jgi:hypothetical protein
MVGENSERAALQEAAEMADGQVRRQQLTVES